MHHRFLFSNFSKALGLQDIENHCDSSIIKPPPLCFTGIVI